MRCLVFLLLICSSLQALSQQKEIDSIEKILENPSLSDTLRIKSLLNLSNSMVAKDTDQALVYANQAMELSNEKKWPRGISTSYNQKGLIAYFKTDYVTALDLFHRALNVSQPHKNALYEASIYSNIGNIYADMEDYDKALENYNQLLKIAKEIPAKKEQIIALVNIATVETELNRYNEAVEKFLEALKLTEDKEFSMFYLVVCNNIGATYRNLSDYKNAVKYYELGIQKAIEQNNNSMHALFLQNIGRIYLDTDRTKEAEDYLLKSIDIATKNKAINFASLSWEALSETYVKQNDGLKALDAYKQHIILRDSTLNDEKKSEIIKKDLEFENEKQQALAQAEIIRQKDIKNGSIIGGSALIGMIFFGLIIYKRKRDAVSQKKEAEFKATVADTELKALRAQMNPHFIFNSLNSINDYISKNDSAAAQNYLTKFAKIMRQTLENSNQKEIALEDDLKLLELYLQIEAMRLQHKFTFEIRVDETLDKENTLMPPLILQPFIENSIWHGISNKEGKGHILIEIKKQGDMLICSVEDDGIGRQSVTLNREHRSLGVEITESRIDILNKLKNSNGKLHIIDKPEGVRVEILLPLQLSF